MSALSAAASVVLRFPTVVDRSTSRVILLPDVAFTWMVVVVIFSVFSSTSLLLCAFNVLFALWMEKRKKKKKKLEKALLERRARQEFPLSPLQSSLTAPRACAASIPPSRGPGGDSFVLHDTALSLGRAREACT